MRRMARLKSKKKIEYDVELALMVKKTTKMLKKLRKEGIEFDSRKKEIH